MLIFNTFSLYWGYQVGLPAAVREDEVVAFAHVR